ncbi:MAG: 50S ribosomal protein L3 [bacterium]|nr:50S ribosomal protein L3 [bacterium]
MLGLIGKKIGMMQIFSEKGIAIPVTMVMVEPNVIIHRKTKSTDGYDACVLGFGAKKKSNRPYSGVFKSQGIKPTNVLREIRDPPPDWGIGKQITASIFSTGSIVEVTSYSKGCGFAGGVKRHGFSGGPAAHGSKFHARPGSVGARKFPARVVKGHPLPGRMGGNKVTARNVEVIKVDEAKNLLFLKGQVPGPRNALVLVKCK